MTLKAVTTGEIMSGNIPDDDEFIWKTPYGCSWVKKGGTDPLTGKLILWQHRTNGPAIIWNNRSPTWWIEGNPILSYSDFQQKTGCSDEDILLYKLKYGEMDTSSMVLSTQATRIWTTDLPLDGSKR